MRNVVAHKNMNSSMIYLWASVFSSEITEPMRQNGHRPARMVRSPMREAAMRIAAKGIIKFTSGSEMELGVNPASKSKNSLAQRNRKQETFQS